MNLCISPVIIRQEVSERTRHEGEIGKVNLMAKKLVKLSEHMLIHKHGFNLQKFTVHLVSYGGM